MKEAERLVVVGNGMVGQRFVEELLERNDDRWTITVLGAEPVPAYDRVALSSLFDGAKLSDLTLGGDASLRDRGVDVHLSCSVESIDRDARCVHSSDGRCFDYDHLVLATGSDPFVPPIPGADLAGCFVYRTVDDLDAIRCWGSKDDVSAGIVIGGGLLGLEAANALRNLGLKTHVIEMADRLMPQQLDAPAAAVLQRAVEDLGVQTHVGFATAHIDSLDNQVCGIVDGDGAIIHGQIVVFSAGIRPRHQLGEHAGLELGTRGGIVINDHCATSDPAISAIGEVACHHGRVHGLVAPGYEMARTLAVTLTSGDQRLELAATPTKLKLLGVDVATFGDSTDQHQPEGDVDRISFGDPMQGMYRRVSIVDGVVTGGVCVGDLSNFDLLASLVGKPLASLTNAPDLAQLIVPNSLAAGVVNFELPDDAQLCSCNNVSRGGVKSAIEAGTHDLAGLAACTKAGTGCGGCKPDLASLLTVELNRLGIEVDAALCEHFSYSRQQLFDLVRFHGHRTWGDVLATHGSGRGCETCRPAIASILASLANGYVLDGDQGSIQDTNDHALANMQRNGTYSVVPRVPGGEITPAQLIELGQIAEDFNLYTKITGGQRIDLFGAQLHELPLIWQRVLDAGMESGHAYGKALRTVKSCVGDVWCRYGVQDAVSMAIRIEKRYRGLRSPHKLKSAVSGCTRECAEAQSKDFGLIATETGWNLYLCGNGGRNPRHADLFATDLSDDQVILYLDRFLMFYIRTAERLQRTAAWFEQLEGGLDYLRSVVIDDALGIAEELEADMARHVDTYQCEWAATLNDAERLSHFVEFVNDPEHHSTPVWITDRHQRVPAPATAGV